MKISEAIKQLKEIMESDGDLNICHVSYPFRREYSLENFVAMRSFDESKMICSFTTCLLKDRDQA